MIAELLHTSARRATPAAELSRLTALTESELQDQIEKEREAGAVILETLQKPGRYYLPEQVMDLYRYLWTVSDSKYHLAHDQRKRRELANMVKRSLAQIHSGRILL